MSWKRVRTAAVVLLAATATDAALAQRAGQIATVQYGTVTSTREVPLSSNAVPGGALVGGTIGLVTGGSSSGRRARNAIIGTAAGAAVGSARQGSTTGMLYDVSIGTGGTVQVVSDQREIREGDCVAVETVGGTANLRRVTEAYCSPENQPAVQAVASESQEEAEECAAAKQRLVDAATPEEADLAAQVVALLCND